MSSIYDDKFKCKGEQLMALIFITCLACKILDSLTKLGLCKSTLRHYRAYFNKLVAVAEKNNIYFYSKELKDAFLKTKKLTGSIYTQKFRTSLYNKCIYLVETYLHTGKLEFSHPHINRKGKREFIPVSFISSYDSYLNNLQVTEYKQNTIQGYTYIVANFLCFLGTLGYIALSDMVKGDIQKFLNWFTSSKCTATSLRGVLSGLRHFINYNPDIRQFANEIPSRLPNKIIIVESYTEEEHGSIKKAVNQADLSLRDKALVQISLSTGLRAVDILNLKLSDIDWTKDEINIVQEKTGKPMSLPLTADIGNALSDYILKERKASDSDRIFLSTIIPYAPLSSRCVIRKALIKCVNVANIENRSRETGSRINRRTMASRMLRKDIPLQYISAALGHKDPETVMHYLSADEEKISECTLSLPLQKGGVR